MQVTLNFLSPEKKALLRTGFVFAFAQSMLFVVFLTVVFSSGMLLGLRVMLDGISESITQQAAGGDRDSKVVNEEIKKVNDYLTRQDSYRKGYADWSGILTGLTSMVPPAVRIKVIHVDPAGMITFGGTARNRQDVLDLQAKLNANPVFKNVVAPLSNILQQHDVDFQFTMEMVNPPLLPKYEDPKAKRSKKSTSTKSDATPSS